MAPDVLGLVVGMLANPAAGLGVAVKKIVEKARDETKSQDLRSTGSSVRPYSVCANTFAEREVSPCEGGGKSIFGRKTKMIVNLGPLTDT